MLQAQHHPEELCSHHKNSFFNKAAQFTPRRLVRDGKDNGWGNSFALRTWEVMLSQSKKLKVGRWRAGYNKVVQDAVLSTERMAEAHHTLPGAIRQTCNVNQPKEKRETWNGGWWHRTQAERRQLNVLPKDQAHKGPQVPLWTSGASGCSSQKPLQTAATCQTRVLCFHTNSAHHFLMQFAFLLNVFNISSRFKKPLSFWGNTKVLHYSALIPHGWRSSSSLKSSPAACNTNSCTKMKFHFLRPHFWHQPEQLGREGMAAAATIPLAVLGNHTWSSRTKSHQASLPPSSGTQRALGWRVIEVGTKSQTPSPVHGV